MPRQVRVPGMRGAARGGAARRIPGRLVLLGVVLVVSAAGMPDLSAAPARAEGAAAGTRSASSGAVKSLEERVAELEVLVRQLRAEIDALLAAAQKSGGGAGAPSVAELQKQIDALTREIERLRIGEAAAPGAVASIPGFGPAAAKVYGIKRGVSVGGYGDMLYQNPSGRRDDGRPSGGKSTLDLDRAVFYFGYKWTDKLLFDSEVEYEHAVAGEGEPGESSVEFAFVDYRPYRGLGVRGGLLLVPLGFLTELHEPPVFLGARRPDVEQFILPSTWRENGIGVYGDLGPITYRACVVASLDATGFSPDEGIREGRQEGAGSRANDLALAARVDWKAVPGSILGAAAFSGRTAQGDRSLGAARLLLWEAHGEWNARGVHLRGLYARGSLDDADKVSLAHDPLLAGDPSRGTAIGSRSRGWYVEAAYNLLSLRGRGDQDLSPFVRFEALDTQSTLSSGFRRDPASDRTVRTYGLVYKPIPSLAIKLDAQDYDNRAGTGTDQVNFALGYLF